MVDYFESNLAIFHADKKPRTGSEDWRVEIRVVKSG